MGTKILVVENEPDLETLIEQKFRKKIASSDLQFEFVHSGKEALEKTFQDESIGIIVAELGKPELNGLELLEGLKEVTRALKTIIVSPYGDLNVIRSAMNLGAFDFVSRPINLDDLESTLMKAISNLQATREAIANQSRLLDIDKELEVAKNIQSSIIPHHFHPFGANAPFSILGTMLPARRIGGDFFDFFPLDDRHLGFSIADVSGKGIPAALFMTMSRGLLRSLGQKTLSPRECLIQLNDILCLENNSCMFVTAFYGMMEIHTGKITYANAGHNPPYILRKGGVVESIGRAEGIALGITDRKELFEEREDLLQEGETLLLYTDGVTEAMNPLKELYGEARLEKLLAENYEKSLGTIIEEVVNGVEAFQNGQEQSDDITLLGIRYTPSG